MTIWMRFKFWRWKRSWPESIKRLVNKDRGDRGAEDKRVEEFLLAEDEESYEASYEEEGGEDI